VDALRPLPGDPYPLGATWDGRGTNAALFSDHADRVELCLFDPTGEAEVARAELRERTDGVWHGYLPGLRPGALYGYRVHGPWDPAAGHRFNPNKLLIDPYARALSGPVRWSDALFGHRLGAGRRDPTMMDRRDSARGVPKAVVADETAVRPPRRPATPWPLTAIGELHLRGHTIRHPDLPEALRGTAGGLAHPSVLGRLKDLGVTALELLPIHAFADEPHLVRRGLRNFWGYNTLAFFAPHPAYLSAGDPSEVRALADALHDAGIELILDVVYNHTAEGDHLGPTFSFRGIDNASYYRLDPADRGRYLNDAGTGNTLDLTHPRVLQLVMDSLRHWAERMGADGFRFDLATTLAREAHGFDPGSGFLDAVRQDPVLNRLKLIAEPWDVGPGGYRLGGFPPGWAEWNDRFRDGVRRFWRGDAGRLPDLAARMAGSADVFDRAGRRSWAGVNYVAAHDGFTLEDLVSYRTKRNHANGEGNRDGHDEEFSCDHGVEGPTADPAVLAARDRHKRCLLATLLVSQGTPMLLVGDERCRTQGGNNNAYCQDGPVAWTDWSDPRDPALEAFVRRCLALRRDLPALRRPRFLHGDPGPDGLPDLSWHAPEGRPMGDADWGDPERRAVGMLVDGRGGEGEAGEVVLILLNAGPAVVPFPLPSAGPVRSWRPVLDTNAPDGVPADVRLSPGTVHRLDPATLKVLAGETG